MVLEDAAGHYSVDLIVRVCGVGGGREVGYLSTTGASVHQTEHGVVFTTLSTKERSSSPQLNWKRTKHIEITHHFIRDMVEENKVNVVYVNPADKHAGITTG